MELKNILAKETYFVSEWLWYTIINYSLSLMPFQRKAEVVPLLFLLIFYVHNKENYFLKNIFSIAVYGERILNL